MPAILILGFVLFYSVMDTSFVYLIMFLYGPIKEPNLPKPISNTTSNCCNIFTLTIVDGDARNMFVLRAVLRHKMAFKGGEEYLSVTIAVQRGEKPFNGLYSYAIF